MIYGHSRYGIEESNVNGMVISHNETYANGVGIVATNATVSANRIHDNVSAGILYYGAGLVLENTVYNHSAANAVGINLNGSEARGNVVYGNQTGITGYGRILGNRVFHNVTHGISVGASSLVERNVTYDNGAAGIAGFNAPNNAARGPSFNNNLSYNNGQYGLLLVGGADSTVFNNTVYQTKGAGIFLQGGSYNPGTYNVQIKNNIVWALAGPAMQVSADNHALLQIDYNDFYATGAGKFGKFASQDYATRAEWFIDLKLDAHSLSVDPQFVDIDSADNQLGFINGADRGADDDFRLLANSPVLDAGDPEASYFNEPVPNGGRVNLGYQGNTTDANKSPPKILQVLAPFGLEKFDVGQPLPIQWRTDGILPPNFYRDLLLADGPLAYYQLGEASGMTAQDSGTRLLDGAYVGGMTLGSSGAPVATPGASVKFDGTSGYVDLPDGFADFSTGFTAEAWVYPANMGAWQRIFDIGNGQNSDNIGFARAGGFSDLQFFVVNGGSVTASKVIEQNKWQHFAVTMTGTGDTVIYKNGQSVATGKITVPRNVTRTSNFLGKSNSPDALYQGYMDEVAFYNKALTPQQIAARANAAQFGTVDIALIRDGVAASVALIADDTPNTGAFNWTIPNNFTAAENYRVRVAFNAAGGPQGTSPEPFTINAPTHDYYLNDGSTVGDVFTTAVGSNANSGRSPSRPMASLQALFAAYDLGPGDVVHVDTGTYELINTIVLEEKQSGVRIEGPATGVALFNRKNSSSVVIMLAGADDVVLDHLSLTGGSIGISATPGVLSERVTVSNADIFGNSSVAIYMEGGGAEAFTLRDSRIHDNDQGFVFNYIKRLEVLNNEVFNHRVRSISGNAGSALISGNKVYKNGYGIEAGGYFATGPDAVLVRDNIAHDNGFGINIGGNTTAIGNIVYGQTGRGASGIGVISGGIARDNVVYGNYNGVSVSGIGFAVGNRVFNNSNAGIYLGGGGATAQGNFVYNNLIGIDGDFAPNAGGAGPYYLNNLVYANANVGIWIRGAHDTQIFNNTVYQPLGDGIRVDGAPGLGSVNAQIRGNIVWTQAGYALKVSNDSAPGFVSDFNNFYTTGAGLVANWAGRDFPTLADWYYEFSYDAHSISTDPLFVDRDGPDNQFGFTNGADHGGDDDFALAPGSPSIDGGDSGAIYFNEPLPNGGRINQGYQGNTARATASPAQVLQILDPFGRNKFEQSQPITVQWQTDGVVPPDALPDAVLADGPIAYYRFGEGSGTVARDSSKAAFPGAYVGNVATNVSGIPAATGNRAAQFDGSSGYVDLPDGFADVSAGFTAEAWIYPTASGSWQRIFDFGNGIRDDNFALARYGDSADLQFFVYKGSAPVGSVTANKVLELNQWQHIAVTMSGQGDVVIYKNGVSAATGKVPLPNNIVRTSNFVGKSNWPDALYQGYMDEVAFYSKALPADRIAAHASFNQFGTVSVALMKDGSVTPVATLADHVPNTGKVQVTLPVSVPEGGGYRVRVTFNSPGGPQGVSNQPFLITNSGPDFYVNDASTFGDVFTSAAGNNANPGKSPSQPMASVIAVLAAYDLKAGDVIHVDSGTYNLVHNIVIGSEDTGFRIEGPGQGPGALIDRKNTNGGNYVFELKHTSDVTFARLSMTGAIVSVFADYNADNDRITVTESNIFADVIQGIFVGPTNDDWVIQGNRIHDINGIYGTWGRGIEIIGSRATISNNMIFTNSGDGIHVDNGKNGLVDHNEVFGNATGIYGIGVRVIENKAHDNNTGFYIGAGESAGLGNLAYSNKVGMSVGGGSGGGGLADGNRVFNNSATGISVRDNPVIRNNQIYSNGVGIRNDGGTFTGSITNNLIYSHANQGIYFTAANGARLLNNTIYQTVGDAVRFENSSGILLRGNLLWVESGSALYVAPTAQNGFSSDYNLLYRVPGAQASTGFWSSTLQGSMADWQTATTQDSHGVATNPGFIDIDGADNVLGYATAGAGYDGGPDDNFNLLKNSPAIDRGDSFSADATDALGAPRADDPGSSNAGGPTYAVGPADTSLFVQSGTAANFRTNNTWFNFKLPFSYPFYGSAETTVAVSTEGFLQFGGPDSAGDNANSDASLLRNRRIAPLWDNLRTSDTGNDIFTDVTTAGQIKFTWKAANEADASPVNFSVVLFQDGRILFDYGAGNTNLTPTIGISSGDGQHSLLAPNNNAASLTNAKSVEFKFVPGAVDIGAYEFQGSSSDTTPPRVTKATGAAGGTSANYQIQITLSEPVNVIDARAATTYEFRSAGPNGVFDDGDDVLILVTPVYAPGSSKVILDTNLPAGALPAGRYRLTVKGDNFHDVSAVKLDGDNNATEGGNYVITNQTPVLTPIGDKTGLENQPVTFTATASDPDVSAQKLSFSLLPGSPVGASITAAGAFAWTPKAAGTYAVTILVSDDASFSLAAAETIQITVEKTNEPPAITASTVNDASAQRSVVKSLAVRFSDNVAASLALGDIVLRNRTTGAVIPGSSMALKFDAARSEALLTFPVLAGGKLPDGNYTLTLAAAGITDTRGNPLAADFTLEFSVLTGDVNGDRKVDELDLFQVWRNLAKPAASRNIEADANGDGQITPADLDVVRSNFLARNP